MKISEFSGNTIFDKKTTPRSVSTWKTLSYYISATGPVRADFSGNEEFPWWKEWADGVVFSNAVKKIEKAKSPADFLFPSSPGHRMYPDRRAM